MGRTTLTELYQSLAPLRHIRRFQLFPTVRAASVAEHCYYTALLAGQLAALLPRHRGILVRVDRARIIETALWPDAAEAILGDLPHTVKREFPQVGKIWDRTEAQVLRHLKQTLNGGAPAPLRSLESLVVKMADCAELLLYCDAEWQLGNTHLQGASARIWAILDQTLLHRFGSYGLKHWARGILTYLPQQGRGRE